jgi:hypothetical protein
MIIFKVSGWTNPIDWAASSVQTDLGFFMSRKGAENKIKAMKKIKNWKYDWTDFQIREVEVLP